ncbi:MAG: GGDEF domain-containing protein [Acidimicrobiales bacterium]
MGGDTVSFATRRGLGRGLGALLPPRPERIVEPSLDALTGLPGHDEFVHRVDDALAVARLQGRSLALVVLGMNGFRRINRTYGHVVGDRVLQGLADRLASRRRAEDAVGRLGGDEFAVLCPNVAGGTEVARLVGRLLREVEQPLVVEDITHVVTATAGVAWTPAGGPPGGGRELVRRADLAMQHAKDDVVRWASSE